MGTVNLHGARPHLGPRDRPQSAWGSPPATLLRPLSSPGFWARGRPPASRPCGRAWASAIPPRRPGQESGPETRGPALTLCVEAPPMQFWESWDWTP